MPFGFVVVLAVLVAQPAPRARSPYLDAVLRYGPGREREAVEALQALRLRDPDRVFDELDRVCRAQGARSCAPRDLRLAGVRVYDDAAASWRRLYRRVLALHVAALASCDPARDAAAVVFHRSVLLRLIDRLDEIARDRGAPPALGGLATTARHLLLWVLQYLREERGLAFTLDAFDAAGARDVDLLLARAGLEELRTLPAAVETLAREESLASPIGRPGLILQAELRQLARVASAYEAVLAADPDSVEAHLRLGRALARQGRVDEAEKRLHAAAERRERSPRQSYLIALFLGDVLERANRRAEAKAAYATAQRIWPGAQASAVGLARLFALDGAPAPARATLGVLQPPALIGGAIDRSDPWLGYQGGQAWRLPDALAALQASFEAVP
jgi:tetratricopeptide (TPR) repeat protein